MRYLLSRPRCGIARHAHCPPTSCRYGDVNDQLRKFSEPRCRSKSANDAGHTHTVLWNRSQVSFVCGLLTFALVWSTSFDGQKQLIRLLVVAAAALRERVLDRGSPDGKRIGCRWQPQPSPLNEARGFRQQPPTCS